MRKFYIILLVALVALFIAACGGKGKERPLPAGSVVVALGDSINREWARASRPRGLRFWRAQAAGG